MLKTIIKRDGREEELVPSKVNGWGQWASGELQGRVDWSHIVLSAISTLPQKATSLELQERLIKVCREQRTWAYSLMAGKLYSTIINKKVHPEGHPSIQALHRQLADLGLMRPLAYSDEEYAQAEAMIQHGRDFQATYFELHQVREKYSILNQVTGEEYETMQFVYMRMAMALSEDQPAERRMKDVFHFYDFFSRKIINAPTPNYLNLGTHLRGYASCCLYATSDDVRSLAAGDHIAYTMTYMSAGIGNNLNIRSMGDPIRGGVIRHQGKMPYFKALAGAVKANLQNGRGGACTTYYSAYDPDASTVIMMKNPKTTEDKRMRDIDFAIMNNKFLARKVGRQEQMFTFNAFTAPDLMEAFYGDGTEFAELYAKYDADPTFKKNYVSAREVVLQALNQMFETGRGYMAWMDEANRHTPFKEKIRSSNLCTEIFEPTSPYQHIADLYKNDDPGHIRLEVEGSTLQLLLPWSSPVKRKNHTTWAGDLKVGDTFAYEGGTATVSRVIERKPSPEVALCSLAGLVVSNIANDDEYALAAYYALLMVDKCIHQAEYELPHVGYTAKKRLNAGVGVTGLATHLARKNLKYSSVEGKIEQHKLAEKHAFYLIEASLKLGQELGNAPWMYKTKWPEGWLPIDTYAKAVDTIADFAYEKDWEGLRARIIANGGIRNSVTTSFMPTESSSKASGAPNCLYPVRFLSMLKTDEHTIIDWCAPDNDIIGDQYELAFDVPTKDLIDGYAIWQKFSDQGISADSYRRIRAGETISSDEMIENYLYRTKMGIKSSYYTNSLTSKSAEKPTEAHAASSINLEALTKSPPEGFALSLIGSHDASPAPVSGLSFSDAARRDASSEAMSAIDRIAAQARAQMTAAPDDEDGTFIGNDGPVCTSGGCSL